jgi:hypothetical protein
VGGIAGDGEGVETAGKADRGRRVKLLEGLVLVRTGPGQYRDKEGEGWRLVPVDRAYPGRKAPKWYLQKTNGAATSYQSGVFATKDENRLSADYLDRMGAKVYLDIEVEGEGQVLRFTKRKPREAQGELFIRRETCRAST